MSNWSSFKGDKSLMDNWRTFLTEGKSPEKVEELFGSEKRRRERWQQIADAEDEEDEATADPDEPQPESGQASVRVGQTVRNLSHHLMTMDQAKLVQALVISALEKAGYGKAIRMDESKSSKLLRRFLKNPKVLYEIATSGYSHAASQQSQRQARRTSQALPVIDLSSVGIKPENQAQVKNILDRMLSGVGLEVEFGPARSQSQPAAAEPKAPAAAKPKAPAAAEPKAPAAAASNASKGAPPMPRFRISQTEVRSLLRNADATNPDPSRSFRTKLARYLKSLDSVSMASDSGPADSPLVKGIAAAIRDVIVAGRYGKIGGTPDPAKASVEESIDNVFLPIILEEIKKERTRRIIIEETQRVLNEKR